jgi:hypothetical protein
MANVRQPFLFSEMKQKTRDNLIYLAVGLGVVALIVADFVYADSHGQRMWWPSTFASRATYTTGGWPRLLISMSSPTQRVAGGPGF